MNNMQNENRLWTPVQIEVLIHYYVFAEPHPRFNTPSVLKSIDMWVQEGCLTECSRDDTSTFKTTSKGAAMVARWCKTELPTQRWE